MTKQSDKENKIDSPPLFFIFSFLLLISLAAIIFGIKNTSEEPLVQEDQEFIPSQIIFEEDTSLSAYFEEQFSKNGGLVLDEYILGDPFREICGPTSGDDIPAITTGTVCLR